MESSLPPRPPPAALSYTVSRRVGSGRVHGVRKQEPFSWVQSNILYQLRILAIAENRSMQFSGVNWTRARHSHSHKRKKSRKHTHTHAHTSTNTHAHTHQSLTPTRIHTHARLLAHSRTRVARLANDSHKLNGLSSVVFDTAAGETCLMMPAMLRLSKNLRKMDLHVVLLW